MWENIMIVLRGLLHVFEVAAFPAAILLVVVVAIIGLDLLWSWQKGKDETDTAVQFRDAQRPVLGTVFEVTEDEIGLHATGQLTPEGLAYFRKIERNTE